MAQFAARGQQGLGYRPNLQRPSSRKVTTRSIAKCFVRLHDVGWRFLAVDWTQEGSHNVPR